MSEWRCAACDHCLGTITEKGLRILAPAPWLTVDAAFVRCPQCRSLERFPLASIAST